MSKQSNALPVSITCESCQRAYLLPKRRKATEDAQPIPGKAGCAECLRTSEVFARQHRRRDCTRSRTHPTPAPLTKSDDSETKSHTHAVTGRAREPYAHGAYSRLRVGLADRARSQHHLRCMARAAACSATESRPSPSVLRVGVCGCGSWFFRRAHLPALKKLGTLDHHLGFKVQVTGPPFAAQPSTYNDEQSALRACSAVQPHRGVHRTGCQGAEIRRGQALHRHARSLRRYRAVLPGRRLRIDGQPRARRPRCGRGRHSASDSRHVRRYPCGP